MALSNLIVPIVGPSGAGLGEQPARSATLTTTDATEATIASVSVAAGQTVRVEAWITGNMSDGSKTGSWHVAALFKRVGTGNVALVGIPQDVASFSDELVTWAVDIEADTTNQTIDFNVTGAVGETVKWMIRVNYTVQEG